MEIENDPSAVQAHILVTIGNKLSWFQIKSKDYVQWKTFFSKNLEFRKHIYKIIFLLRRSE